MRQSATNLRQQSLNETKNKNFTSTSKTILHNHQLSGHRSRQILTVRTKNAAGDPED